MGCKASKNAAAVEGNTVNPERQPENPYPPPPSPNESSQQQQQPHSQRKKKKKSSPLAGSSGSSSSNYSPPKLMMKEGARTTSRSSKDRCVEEAGASLYQLIVQLHSFVSESTSTVSSTTSNSSRRKRASAMLDKIVQQCATLPSPLALDYQQTSTGTMSPKKVSSHTKNHPGESNDSSLDDKTRGRSHTIDYDQGCGCTALHQACRLLDHCPRFERGQVTGLIESLVTAHPQSLRKMDSKHRTPLHYALAPLVYTGTTSLKHPTDAEDDLEARAVGWRERTAVITIFFLSDPDFCKQRLAKNDLELDENDASARCSPLYRVIETLPDDFAVRGPTVDYVAAIRDVMTDAWLDIGNAGDGDKPLALLYRRFTRQFDSAEKFFAGDNSRPSVLTHRQKYKTAAGNTWRIIELLLCPDNPKEKWRIVHRAVQVECPPDLLRYIVETNAEDLTIPDSMGNLPLHYAARTKPPQGDTKTSFPAFYTKYVVDELLYKFPEAASVPNAAGEFPLTLAVHAGKYWIGGGIKSLHDAYPAAIGQINLKEHESLRRALSNSDTVAKEEKEEESNDRTIIAPQSEQQLVIRDEPHDAIMLVQQPSVDVSEVVASMWAHEEDAGVQMLGCVAISKIVKSVNTRRNHPSAREILKQLRESDLFDEEKEVLKIALSAVAAVVNAMKAHPNEVVVQEKACQALQLMARTDGKREVSFVASGAVAAVVGAMQAHVSDPGVQEEACGAVAAILRFGGADRATIVASVSGLTAILNAIAAHPDSVRVQQQGILCLQEMTREHLEVANLPELPRSHVEPLLIAAKTKFPKECGNSVDIVLSRLTAK